MVIHDRQQPDPNAPWSLQCILPKHRLSSLLNQSIKKRLEATHKLLYVSKGPEAEPPVLLELNILL
jgi:hypothetical protein